MFFMVYLFLFLSIIGLAGVASNPSPHYSALSLVVVAGGGCGVLVCLGSSFLPLILFLVYLGGMLVVFAYSIAFTMSLELDNKSFENSLGFSLVMILLGLMLVCYYMFKDLKKELWVTGSNFFNSSVIQERTVNVSFLYMKGWGFLVISSLALLVALLVVLMVVRGTMGGTLRVV